MNPLKPSQSRKFARVSQDFWVAFEQFKPRSPSPIYFTQWTEHMARIARAHEDEMVKLIKDKKKERTYRERPQWGYL